MLRLFISPWYEEYVNGERWIKNPVTERIYELAEQGADVGCSMYYPDQDADGTPEGPTVMVMVDTDTPSVIGQLQSLPDVQRLAAYRPNMKMSSMPQEVQDILINGAIGQGVPAQKLSSLDMYLDYIHTTIQHYKPGFTGFGKHVEVDRAGEFE